MVAIEDRDPEMPVWHALKWFGTRTVAEHATHLMPYIKPNSRIIDVGCGIGSITLDLARKAPQGFVLGIDYNPDSVSTAKAEAERQGITNVEFMQGDATDLSHIESSSFDISHSHQVMVHLTNPPQVLKDIRRILKPGGIIAIRDNHTFRTYPSTPVMERNWNIYQIFSRKRGARPDAGFVNHSWMHEAGFSWDSIKYGSAAWENPGDRKIFADSQKISILPVYGVKAEEEDQEFLQAVKEGWEEWERDLNSRFVGVDGWVLGFKDDEPERSDSLVT